MWSFMPVLKNVNRWLEKFEEGRQSVRDEHRPRRPREATSPQNFARVEQPICSDSRSMLDDVANENCHFIMPAIV